MPEPIEREKTDKKKWGRPKRRFIDAERSDKAVVKVTGVRIR